jgi:hypothetical protein
MILEFRFWILDWEYLEFEPGRQITQIPKSKIQNPKSLWRAPALGLHFSAS